MEQKNKKEKAEIENPVNVMVVKIELKYTGIIRTIAVPADIKLGMFKLIVVACFGFYGGHAFGFSSPFIDDPRDDHFELEFDEEFCDKFDEQVDLMELKDILPERGSKALLEYDFGDGWEFQIRRMADVKSAEPFTCRKCIGINSFEDCGGPWGYTHIVDALMRIADGEEITDEGDLNLLECAFGEDVKLTRKFAKKQLEEPTPKSITQCILDVLDEEMSDDLLS